MRTRPRAGTTTSCSTSSGTSCSRFTFSRFCSRSGAPEIWRAVAEHSRQKLIRRHPHVFGEVEVAGADEVLRNWDAIKRGESGRQPGTFGEIPDNLPATLYASKVLRRAASAGAPPGGAGLTAEAGRVVALDAGSDRSDRFDQVGDLLLAAVAASRELEVDAELALRAAADRFRRRIEDQEADAERE